MITLFDVGGGVCVLLLFSLFAFTLGTHRSFLKKKNMNFPTFRFFKQLKQVITHSGEQADAVKSFIRRNSGEKERFNNTAQKQGRLNQEVELQS